MLFEKVDASMSTGPPSVYMPPPPATLPLVSKTGSPGAPIGGRSPGARGSGKPPWFPENKESLITTGRSVSLYAPPPSPFVLLFVTVRRAASSDSRPSAVNPPPPSPAVLPEILRSASTTCASPSRTMPPPSASTTLPGTAGTGGGPGSASLPEISVSVIVTRLRRPMASESPAL
jgi:hypothetical protein